MHFKTRSDPLCRMDREGSRDTSREVGTRVGGRWPKPERGAAGLGSKETQGEVRGERDTPSLITGEDRNRSRKTAGFWLGTGSRGVREQRE